MCHFNLTELMSVWKILPFTNAGEKHYTVQKNKFNRPNLNEYGRGKSRPTSRIFEQYFVNQSHLLHDPSRCFFFRFRGKVFGPTTTLQKNSKDMISFVCSGQCNQCTRVKASASLTIFVLITHYCRVDCSCQRSRSKT